mmetsp:Transcript_110363/g.276303  ORF Transcript_110363/g.276303 Transcript_110363/m.276303 type:complete len:196 (-) Transcript_110363:238-825(-)
MLHRMQAKYSDKPVRFLLFPCNQFGAQEPKPNVDVKAFAEKSVSLKMGNVVAFAKSNLNFVPCPAKGPDSCTPTSAECCPRNDEVYDYLLAATPPHKIVWNFDKIIVGKDGKPYAEETVLHGPDIDDTLSGIIDKLLEEETIGETGLLASPDASGAWALALLAGIAGAAALFVAWAQRAAKGKQERSEGYYLVVA